MVLVEDEKSGFQFFSRAMDNTKCFSAGGNSNIITSLEKLSSDNPVLVIADGAAFGAYIAKAVAYSKNSGDVGMYFPESFEWLTFRLTIIAYRRLY